MKCLLLAAMVVSLAAVTASAATADGGDPNEIPVDGLATYDGYRPSLLGQGWKPVPGQVGDMYGFPEVTCGNASCSADWQKPDGSSGSFTLWPEYDGDDLKLIIAPEWFAE